jgi:hypothetical protein
VSDNGFLLVICQNSVSICNRFSAAVFLSIQDDESGISAPSVVLPSTSRLTKLVDKKKISRLLAAHLNNKNSRKLVAVVNSNCCSSHVAASSLLRISQLRFGEDLAKKIRQFNCDIFMPALRVVVRTIRLLLLLLLNFIRTQKYNINEVQEKIQRVSKEKAIETTSRSQVIVDL